MKKTNISESDDILPEYNFDYSKARKNRFLKIEENNCKIILDPDVAKFFKSSESINNILRAIINSIPKSDFNEIINQ